MAQIRLTPHERQALELLRRAGVAGGADPKAPREARRQWVIEQIEIWRLVLADGRPLGADVEQRVLAHLRSAQGRFWPKPADLVAHGPSAPSALAGPPTDPALLERAAERAACPHWRAAQGEEWRRWVAEHPDTRHPGSDLEAVLAYCRAPGELDGRVDRNRRARMVQASRSRGAA